MSRQVVFGHHVICGDVFDVLPALDAGSVHCCVTSPPYWGLRDYGVDGQLGLEPTPDEYVARMVAVFREVWRVLRDDGTLWLNLGDSYSGSGKGPAGNLGKIHNEREIKQTSGIVPDGLKPKDLIGIPWRVAFALQADGWYLRSDIIWAKKNCMPESVSDRPTKAHEYIFLLSKSPSYYYDADAIRTPHAETSLKRVEKPFRTSAAVDGRAVNGRTDGDMSQFCHPKGANKRTVWHVATQPFPEAHFATYPEKLVEPCVLAGCPVGGTVLDPFTGSGTTGAVACRLGRNFVGVELNPEYAEMAERRIAPHRDQMQLVIP